MIDIILGIIVMLFVLTMFALLVVMCIGDTETFRVIDEKIARFIKDEDDDEII